MKIIISLIAIVLIIGIITSIYLFVKNQQIQESIKDVADSEFVEDEGATEQNEVASEVMISRSGGTWNVSTDGEYTVDQESLSFMFTGYKIGGEHTGTFNSLESKLALDEEGQPVMLTLTIDPTSVVTDEPAVDKHLQDGVFFDTAQYSEVVIAINRFENITDTSANAITNVTIKGITKTLSVPVVFEKTENSTTFSVDTKIKISEWNMSFGPVLDDVRVMFEGTIMKK